MGFCVASTRNGRGKARLTPAEQRGLALFKDPAKGNCAACHTADKGPDGSLPLFTDFSYDNLGVPRNPTLAHNRDAAYFDLGLCARAAGDLASRRELCGAFKVPSLRNVARTAPYFHDASAERLEDAVRVMGRHQLGMELPESDVTQIVAFLRTLDGEDAP